MKDSALLKRKVCLILMAHGHTAASTVDVDPMRLRCGPADRSNGAWSWTSRGRAQIGSQWPMRRCARGPVVVTLIADQYHVDPCDPSSAPDGGSFAVLDASRNLTWHGIDGEALR